MLKRSDVIYAFEFVELFHSDNVFGFFDHANGNGLARFADCASLLFGKIAANLTVFYALFAVSYGVCEHIKKRTNFTTKKWVLSQKPAKECFKWKYL